MTEGKLQGRKRLSGGSQIISIYVVLSVIYISCLYHYTSIVLRVLIARLSRVYRRSSCFTTFCGRDDIANDLPFVTVSVRLYRSKRGRLALKGWCPRPLDDGG